MKDAQIAMRTVIGFSRLMRKLVRCAISNSCLEVGDAMLDTLTAFRVFRFETKTGRSSRS